MLIDWVGSFVVNYLVLEIKNMSNMSMIELNFKN